MSAATRLGVGYCSCLRQLALSLVICASVGASGFAQGLNGATLPSERSLSRFGLELAWWNHATLEPSRDRVKYFTADEEISYVQSNGGLITAFDNTNGRQLWSRKLGRTESASFPIVSNDEVAIVAVGTTIYAIKRHSGELAWEAPITRIPSASPSVDDKQVYIGTLNGSVIALDLRKLAHYHQENLLPRWANLTVNWQYQTGSEITTSPIAGGIVVDVAARDGSLYGLSTGGQRIHFQFETDAPISAPLAYSGGKLYLASEDNNVYCVDANTGVIRWEFVSGVPIRKAPQVIGKHVYLLTDDGGMFCLSADSGTELWWSPKVNEFVAATNSLVYASDISANILILGSEDGALVGRLPMRDFTIRIANDRTDRLFLANPTGLVLCVHEQNRTFPLYHKQPERRPVLPEITPEETPSAPAPAPSGDASEKPEAAPAAGKN